MKEYIEKEAALTQADKVVDNFMRLAFRGLINYVPVADVVPRSEYEELEAYAKNQEECIKDLVAELEAKEKTGKWIDKWYCSNMSGYEYAMKCSECGKPTYRISLIEPMPNYCPNCGARMVKDD